ncbi:methyltransferase domain-containing protein [Candidatus Woesearchaeota archaeon]|nr:methyltransferase domain-containing protein [Candidatus Woesearchaeota archaeon]
MKNILIDIIVCPECSGELKVNGYNIDCSSCNASYKLIDGIPELLTEKDKKELNSEITFSKRYSRSKRVSKLSYMILKQLDKIPIPNLLDARKINHSKQIENAKIILNIGGRSKSRLNKQINLDVVNNENTDLIGNVENIPLKDNSVDFINFVAVLEHIKKPHAAVKEIKRVLKKGGYVHCCAPFYYPYHADPRDISRFTREGLRLLFEDFEETRMKNIHGPTTSALKVFQIYLPILFSFNSIFIYEIEYILFSYILYPFKFLDVFFKYHWKADFISGGFAFLGRKK